MVNHPNRSKQQHTPGPFSVDGIYIKAGRRLIATCQARPDVFAPGEAAANARLLATAGVASEGLHNFLRLDERSPRDKTGDRVFIDVRDWEIYLAQARAIIAKAEDR